MRETFEAAAPPHRGGTPLPGVCRGRVRVVGTAHHRDLVRPLEEPAIGGKVQQEGPEFVADPERAVVEAHHRFGIEIGTGEPPFPRQFARNRKWQLAIGIRKLHEAAWRDLAALRVGPFDRQTMDAEQVVD